MFDIDLRPLVFLAAIGLISMAVAIPLGLFWLWHHIHIAVS